MTRKHFQAIADVLAGQYADAKALGSIDGRVYVRRTAEALAIEMGRFNPNFDRAKFLKRVLSEPVMPEAGEMSLSDGLGI